MPVAKSFQEFEMLCEPYVVSGKMYIRVRNPKTGTERQVRWYSDAEYAKAYPEAKSAAASSADPYYKTQKEVLGFTNGFITIFKGDTYAEIDWFRASSARYTRWWGWYFVSTDAIPEDLPAGCEPVRVDWEQVGGPDGNLYTETCVKEAIDRLIYDNSESEFQGSLGERIERTLTVKRAISLENNFGSSMMHIMTDPDNNIYVWTTASKSWTEGSIHRVRGTVKDHRFYRGDNQTVLTRCMEVK